jgi:sigma-B regulation protein RsbU (phosphoserine phosphatase)
MLYNKIFFMVVSVISALVLYRIEKISKKYFDKKYYRQKFDYKYAQTELVKLLESKFTIESLAKLIIEKICDLVHLKRGGAVFFPSDEKLWDNKSYCYDSLKHVDFCFNEDADIINSIKKFSGPFSVDYLSGDFKYTLKQNGFKYILPFKTQERLVGALFIGEKLSEIPLNNEDIEFLESVVAGASVAIENAFLYEELTEQERFKQELEIAHRIQLASLPQNVPVILGLDICAASLPALEVGGDFYDFLNGEDGKITVIIGDVSGKGTSAALYMSKIQGILQTLNEFSCSPSQLLTRANKLIYKHIDSKSFITVAGATFNTTNKTLSLARAGHLPLFHLNSKNNSINKMQPGGIGIGLSDDETFKESLEEIKLDFQKGDIFLLVSDGITESINKAGEQFGENRLTNYLKNNNNLNSRQICEGILLSVKNFSGDMKQFDDMTLVVVKAE